MLLMCLKYMKIDDERKMYFFFFTHRNKFEMWEQLHIFFLFTFRFEKHVRDCDHTSGPFLRAHAQMLICKI
jgi:hypothetical protein